MGEKTEIGWTDSTFNPWIGCTKVSAGCDRCYAETLMDTRLGRVQWGPHGARKRTSVGNWAQPIRWNARALRDGVRRRVFCASLADVFDNQAPQKWRNDLWAMIEETDSLDWLLLTKRPENIMKFIPPNWRVRFPANVWVGTTCEDQEAFDHRWPILQCVNAKVRFVSYEPAVGPLRLMQPGQGFLRAAGLNWLICGGESGAGYRDMPLQWEADIRRDCELAGVSYFFKQLSGKKPIPPSMTVVRQFPGIDLPIDMGGSLAESAD